MAGRCRPGPTVFRHFPAVGDLVQACDAHVWAQMRPPMPDTAAAVFEGLESTHERLVRLVEEIDAFYDRSAFRLRIAGRDREKIPALGHSFAAVEGGIEALGNTATEAEVRVVAALTGLEVW